MACLKKEASTGKPKAAFQTTGAEPQEQSPFFRLLPQELRNNIYSQVFFSTRLLWGAIRSFSWDNRTLGRTEITRIIPSPNALALLRTCRRMRYEIGDTWMGKVLFSFEDPETMLDKLTVLPPTKLSKIRHLRILGHTMFLIHPYDDYDVEYSLVSALALLSGLRLDTLTVLGTTTVDISYDTLNGLIKESRGWKELRYICDSSAVLGFAYRPLSDIHANWERYLRKPQPSNWQSIMEARDGIQSQPSVLIYKSAAADRPCSILDPKARIRFEQTVPTTDQELRAFGTTEDPNLMDDDEIDKQLLIVVKRGTKVDYEQRENSPLIKDDIRREMPGRSWKEIRYECIDRKFERSDDNALVTKYEDEDKINFDTYDDVDNYYCPKQHFKSD